jgi:adenylate kinase
VNLVLLGAPGSGKGTQAKQLVERKKLQHISSGDLLRAAVAAKTPLGMQVQSIMAAGKGWMLDGYPRTAAQAEAFEDVLSTIRETIDAVLVLEVDPEVVIDRLSKRRICGKCQAVYHLANHRPKREGICDACGGELIHREDDRPETVRKRLEVFDAETLPVLALYEQRYDVYRVDASQPIDQVTQQILDLVDA